MALIRNLILSTITSLFWIAATNLTLHAQTSPFDSVFSEQAATIKEEVVCFTDRGLYIVNEKIRFRANIHYTLDSLGKEWSKVLYVELVTGEGTSLAQGKYQIRNQVSIGEILIPKNVLTGNYILRCYTRWMRNSGLSTYCHVPLKIINPYRTETLAQKPLDETDISLTAKTSLKKSILHSSEPLKAKKQETIKLDLEDLISDNDKRLEGCLTVVPLHSKPIENMKTSSIKNIEQQNFVLKLLPDLFGPTLSGTAVLKKDEMQAVKNTNIHITLLDEYSDYLFTTTDEYGKFSVSLPQSTKEIQVLIQAESSDFENITIKPDQDFDTRKHAIKSTEFNLTASEQEIALIFSRNIELKEIYQQSGSSLKQSNNQLQIPFYGTPEFSLSMDDFVLLPNLEEVFLNLVPNVIPVKRNNTTTLSIRSKNPLFKSYKPLILVDEVPVFDLEMFMSVPTNKISSIDLIYDVYQKGDARFGGLINIHTVDNDLAGIDLPQNVVFSNFTAMHKPYSNQETNSNNSRQPDTRNTIHWIPEIVISREMPQISFKAPDYPGEYVAIFRGENEHGQLIRAETIIRVD